MNPFKLDFPDWEEARSKEAKERQAENMRNNQKQNVQKSSNLNESEKPEPIRTAAEAAKKIGMSENVRPDVAQKPSVRPMLDKQSVSECMFGFFRQNKKGRNP